MEISDLQAFVAVAKHQSFSKACNSLHITQPAVSKRVASLETMLDVVLFNRINRQISLTQAGQQLLPKAQELISQSEDMRRFASSLGNEVSGSLSVATSHHIGLWRLPPILRTFNKRYKQVLLDLQFAVSEDACLSVERGEIEMAIITLPSELPDSLIAQTAWEDDLCIVVGLDHPLLKKKQQSESAISLKELVKYPCVLPETNTETYAILQRILKPAKLKLNIRQISSNLDTLKMLVSAGFGWSLLPKTILDQQVKSIDIGVSLSRNLGLVVHKKRSLSNAAKAMRELVLE